MQWDRVKNILIVILLAVNLFLIGNLGAKAWQSESQKEELEDNLRTLLVQQGLELDASFELPADQTLPVLSLDRSRSEEEKVALAMLGEETERLEQEDGDVRFEGEKGWLVWKADGTLVGEVETEQESPSKESDTRQQARSLLEDWGLWSDGASISVSSVTAVLRGTVAAMPVHNRTITLSFERNGVVRVQGLWSFGTPYTTARGSGISCTAADALLAFAAAAPEAGTVLSMTAGYRLQADGNRRMQLTPTWKIETNTGEYLVDCDKKTIIEE